MGKYDDIINLPHYEPKNHKRMSMYARAAQFAPFAALTGYEESVKETARLTNRKIEIDEEFKETLDWNLQEIQENISSEPKATIKYFIPDIKKSGGKYVIATGIVKKIDKFKQTIILNENKEIPISEVIEIVVDYYNCTKS